MIYSSCTVVGVRDTYANFSNIHMYKKLCKFKQRNNPDSKKNRDAEASTVTRKVETGNKLCTFHDEIQL